MEKQPGHQLELFSDSQDEVNLSAKRLDRDNFARHIWGYEKTILIIIALLVTGIVTFSLGVEKGKQAKQPLQQEIIAVKPELTQPQQKKEAAAVKEQVVSGNNSVYTIQVASFKTDTYAKKEVELLKKRGYKAVTLNKGGHIILCVGNFPDKQQAQSLLSELSRYYKDCRIRRL